MFKNKFQGGVISVFSSTGSAPLSQWAKFVKNGHIKRVTDKDMIAVALEIAGVNAATTYITIPRNLKQNLGIRLPFVIIIAKNLNKYFTFEITILDDANMKRRFTCSNFQSKTKIKTFFTTVPVCLIEGWNKIQFNLADLTRRAYGTLYTETVRIEVHANVRLRRIYFAEKLFEEEELPREYRVEPVKKKPKPGLKGEGDGQTQPAPPPGVTPPPSTPPAEAEKKGSIAAVPVEEPTPAPPSSEPAPEEAPPPEVAAEEETPPAPEEGEKARPEGEGEAAPEEGAPTEGEEAPRPEEAPAEPEG